MWWHQKQENTIPDWVGSLVEFIPDEQLSEEIEQTWAAAGAEPGPSAAAGGVGSPRPVPCPPTSNTGGILTLGLDWLQGTFPAQSPQQLSGKPDRVRNPLHQVSQALCTLFGRGLQMERGRFGYRRGIAWGKLAVLLWDETRREACVSVTGEGLSCVSDADQLKLLKLLSSVTFRTTRADLRADDYSKELIKMDDVHAAGVSGSFVRFRSYRPITERGIRGNILGDTAYFGRRGKSGGGRYVRFYDKNLESKGRVNCNRYECEFSGEQAYVIGEKLMSAESVADLHRVIGEALAGAVDFCDRGGSHGHRDRMPRLSWWGKIVESLGKPAAVYVRRLASPFQKTASWLFGSALKPLTKLVQVLEQQGHDGLAFITDRINQTRERASAWRPEVDHLSLSLEDVIGWLKDRPNISDEWAALR